MTFREVLVQIIDWLKQDQRVSYRALKREFDIDDDYIEDLKEELIEAQQLAVDENGRILVWTGEAGTPPTPVSVAETSEHEPLSYTPTYLAEKILTSKSALEGERKVVTVLFADIKDSTELIRDLDPEAAQKLLDPAIHIMMEAVHRFEGTVNQVLGDGVMSIFGAPIAHEDHAGRACYAALAMQAAMQPYADEVRRTHGIPLQIRVGLNSGEVVVRTISSDLHMDYSAVGSTTHLAARMEQLATPGSIVLSGSTLRLVEGFVRVNELGPIPVKGMDKLVEVYELTGASTIRRLLQAAVARGLTRFVGRDTEIASLNQALERASSGNGQIVAAVGEAGVGKSRLVYEFVHSHRTQGWLMLESASVSYGKATPYFPVIDLLKRYAHVEDGDDARTIRAKVMGQIMTLDEALQDTIPSLLSLLDALPEESPFLELDPPQRRQRTLDGLKRILLQESQVQPLLLVFEDLHWHDNESQALLDSLVESLPTAQLLLLVNYRPEYNHSWGSKTYYTQLRLDPLPPENSDEFLTSLLGNDASLESLKRLLIDRTQGVPFFLEESVRTLVETQVLAGEPGTYRLVQDLPMIQVPPTVQAVLAARIDRLPQDEKNLLQTAAVIGTEVSFTLLQAIAEMPEDILYPGLTHLQATEFLYETSLFPERVYTFKHALTHEVAYNSLLQERRRVLHARIVDALETLSDDPTNEQVERLAHHAFRGEVWDKAFVYFRLAGAKSMERSANRESVACFEQALEALRHLPENRDTMEQAIQLRFDLRTALLPLGELGRLHDYLRESETLAEALGDTGRLGWVYSYLCFYFHITGASDRAIEYGQRVLALDTVQSDFALQVTAHHHMGATYHILGDYRRAIDLEQKNVAALKGDLLHEHYGLAGMPAVLSRAQLAWSLAELGSFAQGIAVGEEGMRIAETVDHAFSLISSYRGLGLVYLRKGDLQRAISVLERGLELCQTTNIRAWLPWTASTLGYAYALSGRLTDALPLMEQAVEQATAIRLTAYVLPTIHLSEGYVLAGRITEALNLALHVHNLTCERKERGSQAWCLRLLGIIQEHRNPPDIQRTETHYQQSLALANELSMRPLQAHCHRSLGTLYHQTGQAEQALTELSTAIKMYREMEMTFWLPETESALTQVEGR